MPLTPYDDDQIDPERPEGVPPPTGHVEPGVPLEFRDEENLVPGGDEGPGYLDEEEAEANPDVAETVGTSELPCGIGDTEFPCGVMADEDPDSSGGASDMDQGF